MALEELQLLDSQISRLDQEMASCSARLYNRGEAESGNAR
jgi:hypothetical protein